MELSLTLPVDGTVKFNIPYPISSETLMRRLAFHGGALHPAEGRALRKMIIHFAQDVANNHGWKKPYRPDSGDSVDCIEEI